MAKYLDEIGLRTVWSKTKEKINEAVSTKQDKLTAGDGITIDENNVISATGGSSSGTTVTANPTLSGSEADLTGITIDGTSYKIPSGGSGSGTSGSLIIEKELTLKTDPYITLTENDFLQLSADPNGIIKTQLDGITILFKQLLPILIVDQVEGTVVPSLKFYSEIISEDVNSTEKGYYVLSAGSEDQLKYYLSIQENLFDDNTSIKHGFVNLGVYGDGFYKFDGLTGTLSDENYNLLHYSFNSVLGIDHKYRYYAVIHDLDGCNELVFHKNGADSKDTWSTIYNGSIYILTINLDKTWSIKKQRPNQFKIIDRVNLTSSDVIDVSTEMTTYDELMIMVKPTNGSAAIKVGFGNSNNDGTGYQAVTTSTGGFVQIMMNKTDEGYCAWSITPCTSGMSPVYRNLATDSTNKYIKINGTDISSSKTVTVVINGR